MVVRPHGHRRSLQVLIDVATRSWLKAVAVLYIKEIVEKDGKNKIHQKNLSRLASEE